jgi:GNAT superfamily N-acetyltransferase
MSQLEIVPVRKAWEHREFLTFPWKLYRHDPYWVPPLRRNQRELVGYARHPFYDAAEAQTFLARRNGQTVGRIAGIVNHAYNRQYSSEPLGFFGFFESIDDQEVATGLLDAARTWLAERNLDVMRGPANPSMNYECGLLVEGFDSAPTFMMTYNPPYYVRLLENYGLRKAHDLLGYIGYMSQMPEIEGRTGRIAEQCMERYGVTVRPMDRRHFKRDVETFLRLYNHSMVLTWGFVPISPGEMRHLASSLRHLIHADLAIVAEVEGRPAGVVLCLPDYNPRIKEIDGRLFPFGFLRLLSPRKDIKRVRVVAINVLPEFQRVGVGLVLLRALVPAARQLDIEEAEFSWVLESNDLARLGLEKGGARYYKRWRMYDYGPQTVAASASAA